MKLFNKADGETIKQTIAIYRKVLGNEKKYFLLGSIFIPFQHFLYLVLLPLLISFFTQELINHPGITPLSLWLIGGMVLVGVGSLLAARIGFTAFFNHEERMTSRLTDYAMRGLLTHSHAFFANSKVGSLAGDVNNFSRSYLSLLDTAFLQGSSIAINFIASLVVVAFVAPIMLPILTLLTVSVILLALHAYNKRSPFRNERKEMQSKLMGSMADVIGNQTLVRTFGRGDNEVRALMHQRKKIEDIATREVKILEDNAELRLGILILFQIITLVICLALSAQSLLSIAALIFIITYLGRVTSSLFAINSVVRMAEQAFLDAAKMTEILQLPPDVVDSPDAKNLTVKKATITLQGVSFAYNDNSDQAVFESLDLDIKPGTSIGLVGRSGGGKSTLTHLLLRYMDIQAGQILIDGQNIANVTQDSLRDSISYVPQDPFLFHRSLRANIAYGKPDATDAEIETAAKQAYAMDFIKDLPQGLDTVVGERGVKLSGGQRQRIAIARAILKDAPIIILDEATSALDSESENYIQKAISKLMDGRTSIVIAHRLSTIAKLDRIIVIEKGAIIEDGTHKDLLENDGIYSSLWKHQSGGFIED